jgi:hypothetical protein
MLTLSPAPASAGPAGAPPKNAGISAWKARVDTRIELRLKTLAALKIAIGGATNLTSSDKSTLSALVSGDISGLTTLKSKTDAETTVDAVKADGHSMVVDFRIYMLVVPKVRFTVASETETAAIARLRSVHDKLAALATQLAASGKDVSAEQAKLADAQSHLAAATSALDGKVAGLLGVAPSPDASAMKAAVSPVRTAVHTARADIKAALGDEKSVRNGLKALS